MRIPAIRTIQFDNTIFLASITASDLLKKFKIDYFDAKTKRGYQRQLSPVRIKNVSQYLIYTNGIFPQSVLLNSRKKMKFLKKGTINGTDFGYLTFTSTLWLLDGQHRIHGIINAISNADEPIRSKISSMMIPVSIMQVNKTHERGLFYIINERQKGVKADLTSYLVWLQSVENQTNAESLMKIEGQKYFHGLAIPILEKLNSKSNSPFKNKIRLYSSTKRSTYQVPQNTMVRAISAIIKERMKISDERKNDDVFVRKIIAYWNAITKTYSTAYKNPEQYTLLRTSGIHSFSKLFVQVEELCDEDTSSKTLEEKMKKRVLQMKNKLESRYSRHTGNVFWDKTNGNELAMSSNMKSVNKLVEIMRKGLT